MGVVRTFLLSSVLSLLCLPLFGTARYRLKYCLKGPLNPKQPTNQLSILMKEKCKNKILIFFTFCMEFSAFKGTSWLVDCFVLNGPLRQYFSLYRAVSRREGERRNDRRKKNVKTTPCSTYCKCSRPLPNSNSN